MTKISDATRKQIIRECKEFSSWELVTAYSENRGGHIFEHIAPFGDLKKGIRNCVKRAYQAKKDRKAGIRKSLKVDRKTGAPREAMAYSIFSKSNDEVAQMISECLLENVDSIVAMLEHNLREAILYMDFPSPIGIGILEQGDWNKVYNFSSLDIVVVPSNVPGRVFGIKTAYPELSLDDSNGDDEMTTAMMDLEKIYFERHPERRM